MPKKIDLDELERIARAATTEPWRDEHIIALRPSVTLALIARIRELEQTLPSSRARRCLGVGASAYIEGRNLTTGPLSIRGSWYRDGSNWIVLLTGDAVQIGIGDTIAKAWESREATAVQSTRSDSGESSAIRWGVHRGWISIRTCSSCSSNGGHVADCECDHGSQYGCCPACEGTGSEPDLDPANEEAAASVRAPVGRVDWSDDTHPYVACCYARDGDEPGDCYVRHGEDELGLWWLDDGDDSTRVDTHGPYGPYDIIAAAEGLAAAQHEGLDGEDAEAMSDQLLHERAGEPDPKGRWCVWWGTALDDSHVVDRYATADAAATRAETSNRALAAQYPDGGPRCGYKVRRLVDGAWVKVDDDDYGDDVAQAARARALPQ